LERLGGRLVQGQRPPFGPGGFERFGVELRPGARKVLLVQGACGRERRRDGRRLAEGLGCAEEARRALRVPAPGRNPG
jgi:hypothetical protein